MKRLCRLLVFLSFGWGCAEQPNEPPEPVVERGTMEVRVLDQLEMPVMGALITASRSDRSRVATATTDEHGVARLGALEVGGWLVRIETPANYTLPERHFTPTAVQLQPNSVSSIQFTLTHTRPQPFGGTLSTGFEHSGFTRCGAERSWWLPTWPTPLHAQYERILAEGAYEVFVRFDGVVSDSGRFGHLGAYAREIRITSVDRVRALWATDCASNRLSVAPSRAMVSPGDTVRLSVAGFDEFGNPDLTIRPAWTSSRPEIARVDEEGVVIALQKGHALLIATYRGQGDTTSVNVWQRSSLPGYAEVRGTVIDTNGGPYQGKVSLMCGGGYREATTNTRGEYSMLGYVDSWSSGLTDARQLTCELRTVASSPSEPLGSATREITFNRPGKPLPTYTMDVIRKPR